MELRQKEKELITKHYPAWDGTLEDALDTFKEWGEVFPNDDGTFSYIDWDFEMVVRGATQHEAATKGMIESIKVFDEYNTLCMELGKQRQ